MQLRVLLSYEQQMLPYFKEIEKAGDFFSKDLYRKVTNGKSEWTEYYNFLLCPIDPEAFLLHDDFYSWLYRRHRYNAGVLCMGSRTVYNWHRDTNRGVCINSMMYTPNISFTYFRKSTEDINHDVIELPYKPCSRFIFNNQEDHMVANHAGTRLMLTVEFEEDKESLSFESLLDEIETDYKA